MMETGAGEAKDRRVPEARRAEPNVNAEVKGRCEGPMRRKGRDSNPRDGITAYAISSRAH